MTTNPYLVFLKQPFPVDLLPPLVEEVMRQCNVADLRAERVIRDWFDQATEAQQYLFVSNPEMRRVYLGRIMDKEMEEDSDRTIEYNDVNTDISDTGDNDADAG